MCNKVFPVSYIYFTSCWYLQRAISEIAGLDAAVIEEEFVVIASSAGITSHNKCHAPLINLEGFGILMERLETLGEDTHSDMT